MSVPRPTPNITRIGPMQQYIISHEPRTATGFRAFDARSGAAVSPCFLGGTAAAVRAWMKLHAPDYEEEVAR